MADQATRLKAHIQQSVVALLTLLAITGILFSTHAFAAESPGETQTVTAATVVTDPGVAKLGLIAASVAFGLGAVGAGIAIAHVGAAAMGAVAEKPEIAGQALIFVALAEGIVVFGFITALMILGKV